ncbi:hypothetical protein LJE86_07125 [bacterium BMS3Abin03]|nr:hypothetical protein [bacterium BMS3Abin03]
MKKYLSAKLSGKILISLLLLLLAFHILVLVKVVPNEIVWRGQIDSSSDLLLYEGLSVFITIIFIVVISLKIGLIKSVRFTKVVNITTWIIFIYFLLNTTGNLTSEIILEKIIFTPITIVMTILAFRLAIEK